MDCFKLLPVTFGRCTEKRWGIKCLTRVVHVDLLSCMDDDAFIMALRWFIAQCIKPAELLSDQGTNFKGERELMEAFADLAPNVQQQFANQKISFHFNFPASPHFGGVWEKEIHSIKYVIYTTVGFQQYLKKSS